MSAQNRVREGHVYLEDGWEIRAQILTPISSFGMLLVFGAVYYRKNLMALNHFDRFEEVV